MTRTTYEYTISRLFLNIYKSGAEAVLSEREMWVLVVPSPEELFLLVRESRLTLLFIRGGKIFFRLERSV